MAAQGLEVAVAAHPLATAYHLQQLPCKGVAAAIGGGGQDVVVGSGVRVGGGSHCTTSSDSPPPLDAAVHPRVAARHLQVTVRGCCDGCWRWWVAAQVCAAATGGGGLSREGARWPLEVVGRLQEVAQQLCETPAGWRELCKETQAGEA